MQFDFDLYICTQRAWSLHTFGEGARTEGLCKHIEKELAEIRSEPTDLTEYIDVIILALDLAHRQGFTPSEIIQALIDKQHVNMKREWPKTSMPDEPTEHVRG